MVCFPHHPLPLSLAEGYAQSLTDGQINDINQHFGHICLSLQDNTITVQRKHAGIDDGLQTEAADVVKNRHWIS